jgi:tol-pal system protein YbgF
LTATLSLVLLSAPAWTANRDMERLQIQVSTLQTQISDLQKVAEENLKEIKRLNEQIAAQSAAFQRLVQDRRAQDESAQLGLKEMTERLSELAERLQAGHSSPAPAPAPTGSTPTAGATFGGPSTTSPTPSAGSAAPASPTSPPPALPAPRELYSQAYADYARGNYDVAVQGFQEYLRSYPNTDFSDNAQYWIGECLYGKQKYAEAIEAWNALLRDFPSSDKLPDARFKKGLALERLGRRSQALVEYRYVVDRYPNSEAGRKAREKLSAP